MSVLVKVAPIDLPTAYLSCHEVIWLCPTSTYGFGSIRICIFCNVRLCFIQSVSKGFDQWVANLGQCRFLLCVDTCHICLSAYIYVDLEVTISLFVSCVSLGALRHMDAMWEHCPAGAFRTSSILITERAMCRRL